jgi:hypothetical protein
MSFGRKKDKKVEVSFTNWVLGGSLLSLTSTESDRDRRRSASKRVIVTEVKSVSLVKSFHLLVPLSILSLELKARQSILTSKIGR